MKVIGVIPARWSSSRFEGKPLADIFGKPMIWWVYNQAKKVKELDEIIIATDDNRILDACQEFGMHVMMTSSLHKTGAERVAEVAKRTDGDIYLNIQGDEPLIDPSVIRKIILEMKKSNSNYYVGLRSQIKDIDELRNPNIVKAVTDINGFALYFSRVAMPYSQSLECVYRVMGLYGYRKDFLLKFAELGQTKLEIAEKGVEMLRIMENGYKIKLIDTDSISIGVDTPSDLEKVKSMIIQQKDANT